MTNLTTFNRLWDDFPTLLPTFGREAAIGFSDANKYPPFNILEKDDNTFLEIAAAGLTEKDIKVSLNGRVLSVDAQYPKRDGFTVREQGMSYKSWGRSFRLSQDAEVVGSSLKDGILSITLKREQQKSPVKEIPITREETPVLLNE